MRAAGITIVALLFLFFAGTQALLPPFLQARVEEALLASFPETRVLNVRLSTFPAFRLLQGEVGRTEVDAEGIRLGDLPLDGFHLSGRGVRVDVGHLMRNGQLRILEADELRARAEVSEEALNGYLRRELDPVGRFQATVEEDGIRVDGGLQLLGRAVEIVVQGDFEVRDGNRVEFVPRHISVDDAVIPRFILDSVVQADQLRIGLNLGTFPIPLEVRDVVLQPGRIVIDASQPLAEEGAGR